jgi:hypothetical protein
LEDDADARAAIGEDVVKLVVPSLVRFTNKYREKEFSKSKSSLFNTWNASERLLVLADPQKCAYWFLFFYWMACNLTLFSDIKQSSEAVEAQLKAIYR